MYEEQDTGATLIGTAFITYLFTVCKDVLCHAMNPMLQYWAQLLQESLLDNKLYNFLKGSNVINFPVLFYDQVK